MTQETIEKVMTIVKEEMCFSDFTPESSFEELGVDSLDFLGIINRVRNEVGPVPDSIIGSIDKVIDLAAAVGVRVN